MAQLLTAQALKPTVTPAQKLLMTNEDSLNMGTSSSKTVVSGYGSAFFQRDFNEQLSRATLERAVLFVGHQFNSKISLFTELELENAKVGPGTDQKAGFQGEVSMEQAYLKFNLNSHQYLVAGLFVPRIGILNENHLPVNFNGVERPMVEQLIIPATWRELGIGFYGHSRVVPINYTVALVNGLDGSAFAHGTGLIEGRAEGQGAFANNIAITASVQYFLQDFKFQLSGYAGGANGQSKRKSDSLMLESGPFAESVYLGEGDVQYSHNGFSAKALGTFISYDGADKMNRAYANNIAQFMYGAYGELAYNLFEKVHNPKLQGQQFNVFARYELLDMNAKIPDNGIYDGKLKQQHIIAGVTYLPIPNVAIKADVRLLHTGEENPQLVINPSPARIPYRQNDSFLNVGIGYSF
ncbi:hypothetical protein GA0116948_11920 [Chitinophaga costaii]|uniref:Phosphate-selective porin O and P n=2 Tax=Chitinophaga costaii TaxID=1335309 RepID=A0A1C4G0A0_9BACT|nr:hypothetical protein GA0116948_11920 [Chitinophaga costaii]